MKKQAFKEITSKSKSELRKEINKIKMDILKLKIEESVGKSKNLHAVRQIRKNLAQTMTVLNSKSEDAAKEKNLKGGKNG